MNAKLRASIIIPFYDCFDLIFFRLAEMNALNIPPDVEVILANDGSEEIRTLTMLEKARLIFPFFRSVGFEKHRGFSSINNLGARESLGEILYFVSNDVKILKPFWNVPLDYIGDLGNLYGGRLLTHDTGWNTFLGVTISYLEGWFISCLRDVFFQLGGWDERYDPHDYEDIDLSLSAISDDVNLFEFPSGYVEHLGCGTIGKKKTMAERMLITERNRKRFHDKWEDWFLCGGLKK